MSTFGTQFKSFSQSQCGNKEEIEALYRLDETSEKLREEVCLIRRTSFIYQIDELIVLLPRDV